MKRRLIDKKHTFLKKPYICIQMVILAFIKSSIKKVLSYSTDKRDIKLASKRLKGLEARKIRTIPAEEVWKEL